MKIALVACGAFALAMAASGSAMAGNEGDGSGYGTQPGFAVANGNTECAGHGSFGAFGKGANLGIDNPPGNPSQPGHADFLGSYPGPGTDGTQTGLNNSGLCGNRQSPD